MFEVVLDVSVTIPCDAGDSILASMLITGTFTLPDDATEEEAHGYVPTLCLANLYSTARGIIAGCSGLMASGPLYLPLINMHEIVRRRTEAMQSQVKKRSKTSKTRKKLAKLS
jgi:preprotein translocase subunit SecB